MAEAIGAFILAALQITAEAWVAETIGTIIILAASLAITYALMPSLSLDLTGQKATIRQPMASRRRGYGQIKIGGVLGFLAVKTRLNLNGGGSARYLHVLVYLLAHEIDSIVAYFIGEKQVTLTGGLVNEAPFYTVGVRRAKLVAQLGTDDQVAHTDLTTWFPEYTTDHRNRGIANILGIFKGSELHNFNKVFPSGIPSMRCVVKAAKVWDARDGAQDPDVPATWEWRDNAAACVMDYFWHADGMRLPRDFIDAALADWITKLDKCDEDVDLDGGGTEKRWRLAGMYEVTTPSKDVLPAMLGAFGANLVLRGDGAAILQLSEYYEPTVIITDDMIFSYKDLKRGAPALEHRNEIRAKYMDPNNFYEEQEAVAIRDEASIARVGVQSLTLDLRWCPSHSQARRIMKTESYRRKPKWQGIIVTHAYGLDSLSETLIRVQIIELGIDDVFERTSFGLDPTTGRCVIGIRSMPAEAFIWHAEEGVAPVAEEPEEEEITTGNLTGTVEEVEI